jgi:hypothetical protein
MGLDRAERRRLRAEAQHNAGLRDTAVGEVAGVKIVVAIHAEAFTLNFALTLQSLTKQAAPRFPARGSLAG